MISLNDKEGSPGRFTYQIQSTFAVANQLLPDDTIVLQTGDGYISGPSISTGNPFGILNWIASAPAIILVTRLGKMPSS
jgi:hypothetical protein